MSMEGKFKAPENAEGSLRRSSSETIEALMHSLENKPEEVSLVYSRERISLFLYQLQKLSSGFESGKFRITNKMNKKSVDELISFIEKYDYENAIMTLRQVELIKEKFHQLFPAEKIAA